MEERGVGLADDLLGVVSVQAPRALIPELDVAFEVLTDDRGLSRSLEQVADEVRGRERVGEEVQGGEATGGVEGAAPAGTDERPFQMVAEQLGAFRDSFHEPASPLQRSLDAGGAGADRAREKARDAVPRCPLRIGQQALDV